MLNNGNLQDVIQDSNLNFLIGSGLSVPYFETLGNIEKLLTEIETYEFKKEEIKKIIRASIYVKYFNAAISRNVEILENHSDARSVLSNYKRFLIILNTILQERKNTLLGKQINIFTTNIDIFIKCALGEAGLESNDGFSGRFKPAFRLSNFKKTFMKRSAHYDNTFELPVFNLLKLHGSTAWAGFEDDSIIFSHDLALIKELRASLPPSGSFLEIGETETLDDLYRLAEKIKFDNSLDAFMVTYEKLLIVNPTKEKFKQTLLNKNYYEMLRIFSNELEKENSVLFVLGFSFADEHIREITIRVADSNPTLIIYVVAYDSTAKKDLETKLRLENIKNNNVKIIFPEQQELPDGGGFEDTFKYNFGNIIDKLFSFLDKTKKEQAD